MKRGFGVGVIGLLVLGVFAIVHPVHAASSDETAVGGNRAIEGAAAAGSACSALQRGAGCTSQPLGTAKLAVFYHDYEARTTSRPTAPSASAQASENTRIALAEGEETPAEGEEKEAASSAGSIPDPLEPMNRAFYHFNDKLYFWFLKPVARGYRQVVPETARIGVGNFFYNLAGPVRMVNCLLQGKGEAAGYEFVRLFINTTVGVGGLLDVATDGMELERYDEDLGQTLGVYGWEEPLIYLHWPFLGPSSGRDTLGSLGDSFLDPLNYLVPRTKYNVPIRVYDRVNETSLTIGDYEDLKRSALDPYVAIRDAYYQHRKNSIRE